MSESRSGLGIVTESEGPLHRHVHDTIYGMREFWHIHPWPKSYLYVENGQIRLHEDVDAAVQHRHLNGSHSHPHDHARYFTEADFDAEGPQHGDSPGEGDEQDAS